jgi:hypothetical protein
MPDISLADMRSIIISCSLVLILAAPAVATTSLGDVFIGGGEGAGGTPYYRIPSLAVAPNGDLIAFAEGRPSGSDPGYDPGYPVSIVSKRSTDGGASWNSYQVLASDSRYDYGDPRAIVDPSTGKVFILYLQSPDGSPAPATSYYRSSADNGQSWNPAVDITAQVSGGGWAWLDTGPGTGVQLRWQSNPARNGRLVAPSWVCNNDGSYQNLAVYSDSHGTSWSHGALAAGSATETQIVELTNGDLLMDGRQTGGNYRSRWISHDGGTTWGSATTGDIAVGPVNAGLVRYSAKRDGGDRDRILFSAPLGSPVGAGSDLGRSNLGVWTSYDEGKTFINPVQIDSGFAGYSTMQKLPDGSIGVLYEKSGFTQLTLAKFTMSDLEGQTFSSHLTHYDGFGNNIDRNRGGVGWSGSWTGTGVASADYNARLGGTGLHFVGSPFSAQDGRMDLTPGHGTTERQLGTPINLDANSTRYVSLLVSQVLDTGPGFTGKPLDIQLRDAYEAPLAAFGVNSSGKLYLSNVGNTAQSSAGSLGSSATYLLVLKIVSQGSANQGSPDLVYLKAFQSGVDSIPASDSGMIWILTSAGGVNSGTMLDRIALTAGSSATWSFDEVRIGETFGAVASGVAPEPTSLVLLLIAAVVAGVRMWRGKKYWFFDK